MTMLKFARSISILVILVSSLAGLPAFAQFSSGIEGTVKDSSGAVIPGAMVTITNTRLGVTRTATTDQSGYFRIGDIAASTYTVQIEKIGFKTWQQTGLILQVRELRTLSPVLVLGAISTKVTISATPVAVNLANPTTGAVVSSTTVEHTPLPGQNVYALTALSPGMTGDAVTSGDNYTNEYAVNINAAGLRQEQNGYMIDGAYTDTPSRGGGSSISPNPEIVQSIDIRTNDFDAANGRNGGATTEVFTKSGTNQFHGTLDYYFLNNNLSARTEFESTVPVFRRNEFGGTFGGPIIKHKLFFYGAIDVLRSSTTSAGLYTVETPEFDTWAETNLPNNVGTQILKTAPPLAFPTTGIETVAQLEGSTPGYYPPPAGIPATLPAVGTAAISYSVPKNGYQWSIRGDYYASDKDRIYADVMRTYDTTEGATPRPALDDPYANHSDFGDLNWTHTFSPTLLNEAGVSLIRPYGSDELASTMAIPYVNVVGLQGFSNWGPGNFTQTTFGWRDVMTAIVKTHTLKFGVRMNNIREYDSQSGAFDRPTYNFNSLLDFVQDKAATESATPVNLLTHQEASYYRAYRALYTAAYVQDDWKTTPRLTLDLGVRYDMMPNFFSILSPKLTNLFLGSSTNYFQQIADATTGFTPSNHVLNHNIWGLNPRFGFAWDPTGSGKTAVRGGFGTFSDQPPYLHITDITAGNLPNFYTPSVSVYQGTTPVFQLCSAPVLWTEACPVVNTSDVVPNSSGFITGQRANLGGYSPDYNFTQVEEWTLSVERQLPRNLILELNYSGSAAHFLPVYNTDANGFAGDLIINKGKFTGLNPYLGTLTYASSSGNSNGNFGSAMLTLSPTSGLSLRGIYTVGRALDTISNSGSLDGGSVTAVSSQIQNGDLEAQYGRADFDIHQQFAADGTWTVPSSYSSPWERHILGGWQLGGLWLLQTGLPFTVYTSAPFDPVFNSAGQVIGNTGGDYNADGNNYDVPDTPSFGNHLSGQSYHKFLTGLFPASAFPAPPLGMEGGLGRNTFDEPGFNNFDFTITRLFTTPWFFGEDLHLQAQAEFFNLFNRVNLTGVESDLSSSLFGRATNQLPARSIQLHLRASF